MAPIAPASDASYTGTKLVIFTSIFIPLQIFCVGLRYYVRWVIKGSWGLDDILVLFSLFLQLIQAALSLGSVYHAGVGHHITWLEANEPQKVTIFGKYLFAVSLLYFIVVNIPKIAILALYRRLFPHKGLHYIIHFVMAALVMLIIVLAITIFAACIPIAANWEMIPGSHCINKEAVFIYGSVPNIVTDVILLLLPIRIVWNLHASTRLKLGLIFTFTIGSLGLITSVIRFTTFYRNNSFTDSTWNAVDLLIWTQVEAGVYLICSCLPTYRPLLERFRKVGLKRFTTLKKSKESGGSGSNQLQHSPSDIQMHRLNAKDKGFRRLDEDLLYTENITITKDFTVTKHQAEGDDGKNKGRQNYEWERP